jgi:hypothetical protein
MDKVDQLINSEREKSKAQCDFAKPFVKLIALTFLIVFFAVGAWCGLSMFSPLSSEGRLTFIFVLAFGVFVTFALLKISAKTRISRSFITATSTLALGYLLFLVLKKYGGI